MKVETTITFKIPNDIFYRLMAHDMRMSNDSCIINEALNFYLRKMDRRLENEKQWALRRANAIANRGK